MHLEGTSKSAKTIKSNLNNQGKYSLKQKSELFQHHTALHLLTIAFLWGIAIILVNCQGNFPLNDDWSYAIAVKRLVEEGVYSPTAWTSMSLISQTLWGSLFCYLFGFSFEVLRLSTLLLSLLTLFGIYLIVRQLNKSGWIALFVTLLIAFNPIYFALSYTFMTDIPFLSFAVGSLLFFLRYLEDEKITNFIVGTLFAVVAVLCRQTGLFIPIAFGLTVFYKHRFNVKMFPFAILLGLFCLGALLGYQFWLDQTAKTPELYGKQMQDLVRVVTSPELWPMTFAKSILIAIMYLGLFLLPIFVLILFSKANTTQLDWFKKWLIRGILPISGLISIIVVFIGKPMPIGGNIINQEGIGPITLYDAYTLNLPNTITLPDGFWIATTIASMLGATILLIYLFSVTRLIVVNFNRHRYDYKHHIIFFILLSAIIYFLPILFLGYYDRYLLTPLLLIALTLTLNSIKFSELKFILPGVTLLFITAFFSIACTHDYFSWNRARWQALQHLTKNKNVSYFQVDGGFEYNGYMLYTDDSLRAKKTDKWWTKNDDMYAITFGKVEDYKVIQSYEYQRWFPPVKGKILVLKRLPK